MSESIKVPTWALPFVVSAFVGAISYGAAQASAQATSDEVERIEKIVEETGGTLEESELREAYKYAIKEPHDNLTIDFNPKCETMRYRRNLNEFIIFDRAKKECKCKKK